jgi:hypothetical protein
VFKSTDGGAHWAAVNGGLTNLFVNTLAVDPTGATIYAGTLSGLFDAEIAASTTTILSSNAAQCVFDTPLLNPQCFGEVIPADVTRTFDRAVGLIGRATTNSGKHARKLVRQARKVLENAETKVTRAAKGKRPKISAECATVLKAAAKAVAGRLGE